MSKERELLEEIFEDKELVYAGIEMINPDGVIDKILEKFELKRKGLPVAIKERFGFAVMYRHKSGLYTDFKTFETKQEAEQFCELYGLEVVE